jgi:hypothetical protein
VSTPNPATTEWVPLWDLEGGLPPVVNGQWLKGVGGAAVWSAITPADIPGTDNEALMRVVRGTYGATQVKMQCGQVVHTVAVGDPATVLITLPTPWSGAHIAFLGSAWPAGHWNCYVKSAGLTNGLSQGMLGIYNATVQNMTCQWVSFGW